jgi:hypothetical protein
MGHVHFYNARSTVFSIRKFNGNRKPASSAVPRSDRAPSWENSQYLDAADAGDGDDLLAIDKQRGG